MLKIRNPYPGFQNGLHKPYEYFESDYFFGRERDIVNIKFKLRQNHIVSILSQSSFGKTSFLKAGLIPDFAKKLYAGEKGNYWRTIYFTPGKDPIISMARAIVNPESFIEHKIKPSLEEEVITKLNKNDYGLVRVVEDLNVQKPLNVLMLIDDFNRLFAGDIPLKKLTQLMKLLLKAIQSKGLGFYLVTTMDNEDFQDGTLQSFEDLYRLMQLNTYHLRLLDQRGLKSAIETPAKIEKSEIESKLSLNLIEELLGDDDQLRKLQLYLNRTWFEWKKNHKDKYVNEQHFKKATGQRQKAILKTKTGKRGSSSIDTGDITLNSYEADYSSLNSKQQIQFKKIVQALVSINEKGAFGVRQLEFSKISSLLGINDGELIKIFNQVPSIISIHNKFIRANKPDSIKKWQKAIDWSKEEKDNVLLYKALADAAILHYIDGIDIESVFSKEQYRETKQWFDSFKPTEGWGDLYHNQYGLAKDLIEKLEEHYGPVATKTTTRKKPAGSSKIKIGGKAEKPAAKKTPEVAASPANEEDEDAAIAALLAKDDDSAEKHADVPADIATEVEPPKVEKPATTAKKVVLKSNDGSAVKGRKKIVLKKK